MRQAGLVELPTGGMASALGALFAKEIAGARDPSGVTPFGSGRLNVPAASPSASPVPRLCRPVGRHSRRRQMAAAMCIACTPAVSRS